MTEENQHEYIPGTCNIGPVEIRRRYRIGFFGLGVTLVIFIILEILDAAKPYRFLIFPSVYYSLSGFIQAKYRFCYVFGLKGVYSMVGRKQFHSVEEKEAQRKDRWTALKIVGFTLFGSIFITLWYYVI